MKKLFVVQMQRILIILDFIILFFTFALIKIKLLPHANYEYLLFVYIIGGTIAWLGGMYAEKSIISFGVFFKKTIKVYLIWFLILFIFIVFFLIKIIIKEILDISIIDTLVVGAIIIITPIIALLLKVFIYDKTKTYFKEKGLLKRVLIIGYNLTAKKLVSYFEQDDFNTEIVGFAENEQNVKELSHYPIISNIESAVEVAKQYNVDEIYSTITLEQNPKLKQLINDADDECIRFRIVPDFSVFIQGPFHVSYFNDIPILTLRSEPLDDLNNRHIKRGFDIFVSSFVILFILTWLAPLICILILLESRGWPIFSQLRTGKNKKSFPCYKFRSMYVNKDSDLKQATKDDDRITKVGKILRRTSLDEFPQFINVFIGTMSIVGPRPHMVKHTDDYSKMVDQYMVRHFSKPGITGLAQIHGYRGEISDLVQIKNRIEYDIKYMESWNLLLDIKIMFLTIFKILKDDKAY